jgi:hypothetical protein
MIHRHAFALSLPVGAQALYGRLTDFVRLSDWVLIREGDILVAEFEAPGLAPGPVTFELVLSPPRRLDWQQVGMLGERGLSGTLSLVPAADGRLETRIEGELRLKLPWHRWRARARLAHGLNRALIALQLAAGQQSPTQGAFRHKILEIRRHDGRLEIWYQGRHYSAPMDGAGPLL